MYMKNFNTCFLKVFIWLFIDFINNDHYFSFSQIIIFKMNLKQNEVYLSYQSDKSSTERSKFIFIKRKK